MNAKIAAALAQDAKRRNSNSETLQFHDDEAVYTISVTVNRIPNRSMRESSGRILSMSGGAGGSECTCCNGTGRA